MFLLPSGILVVSMAAADRRHHGHRGQACPLPRCRSLADRGVARGHARQSAGGIRRGAQRAARAHPRSPRRRRPAGRQWAPRLCRRRRIGPPRAPGWGRAAPHFRLAPREAGLSVGRRRGRGSAVGRGRRGRRGRRQGRDDGPAADGRGCRARRGRLGHDRVHPRRAGHGAHRRCPDGRDGEQPQRPAADRRRDPGPPAHRAGVPRGLDPHDGRHGAEDGAQPVLHPADDGAGPGLSGPDGQRGPGQHQARRAQPPDRAGDHRLRPATGRPRPGSARARTSSSRSCSSTGWASRKPRPG